MKVTLQGCKHQFVEEFGRSNSPTVTCVHCYVRLRVENAALVPAFPAVPCEHQHKKPIAEQITQHMPYKDALCTDCGCVIRHPDGPGEWTEVLFNGYIIKEEMAWQSALSL